MSESIIDINRVNKILSSCKNQAELYTKIGYDIYKLEYFRCDVDEQKIRFNCKDLNSLFSNKKYDSFKRGTDGNRYNSFDLNDAKVHYNIASIPNFRFRAWIPEPFEIDFWNNLSFRNPNVNGGRRKKSRAKKSRKNRRTRRS
jgi:hypothetical protein